MQGNEAYENLLKAYLQWEMAERDCRCLHHHNSESVLKMCRRETYWRRYCEIRDKKPLGAYLYPKIPEWAGETLQ